MSDWADEYLTLIEDCEARESRLTDWERNFLDDMKSRLLDGDHLTLGQTNKLDEIWERATAKG